MASKCFKFPIRAGKEYRLKEIPTAKEMKFGFYFVRITCENDDFRKRFSFSPNHCYTHTSLYQAIKYQQEYDIKIKLIVNNEPNAYLYEEKDLIAGDKVFGKWFKIMSELKQKFPKNKLIKQLTSSLSGQLTQRSIIYKSYQQIIDEDLDVCFDESQDGQYMAVENVFTKTGDYYELQDLKNPILYNFRLMPFVTSYGRNKLSRVLTDENIKDVIRICVDGISFTKPQEFNDDDFAVDKKTSGNIKWNNVVSYDNVD